jgi:hypothetical protein
LHLALLIFLRATNWRNCLTHNKHAPVQRDGRIKKGEKREISEAKGSTLKKTLLGRFGAKTERCEQPRKRS